MSLLYAVFIANFEYIQHSIQYINVWFLFLVLNIYLPAGKALIF